MTTGTFTSFDGAERIIVPHPEYPPRHPELVSGSQSADHVRNNGDAVNNFNFSKPRIAA